MKFNKKESDDLIHRVSPKLESGMKIFIYKTAVVWGLIMFAFWIGSGCVGIVAWGEDLRVACCFIMIVSLVPISISTYLGGSNE